MRIDGDDDQFFGASIHYFRVPRAYWEDRVLKAKAMGATLIETYVPWNYHESQPGVWDFSGEKNLPAFLDTVQDCGLKLIVRPSPYICAEWQGGGLPGWLFRDRNIRIRTNDPKYLEKVAGYFDHVLPMVVPFQVPLGGAVVAMQVENEYSCNHYHTDHLVTLTQMMRDRGVVVPLFSCGWATERIQRQGTVEGLLPALNYAGQPDGKFALLEKLFPETPRVAMELWTGWFDPLRGARPVRDPEAVVASVDQTLCLGASPLLYVFHGGTNFGFTAGANCNDTTFDPRPTSYDYQAPLDEAGCPTELWYDLQAVARSHGYQTYAPPATIVPPICYPTIVPASWAPFWESLNTLGEVIENPYVLSMEECGLDGGYLLYSSIIPGPIAEDETLPLLLHELHDRATVFIDGKHFCTLERDKGYFVATTPPLPACGAEGLKVDLLVENMARPNFGAFLPGPTGITQHVRLGEYTHLHQWSHRPLSFHQIGGLPWRPGTPVGSGPWFVRFEFDTQDLPSDTFVTLPGWGKGVLVVNDRVIGRYFSDGCQRAFYLPGPWLLPQGNVLVLFEETALGREVEFIDHGIWT